MVDVFLEGGAYPLGEGSEWREREAIPLLRKMELSFFDPAEEARWRREEEKKTKEEQGASTGKKEGGLSKLLRRLSRPAPPPSRKAPLPPVPPLHPPGRRTTPMP